MALPALDLLADVGSDQPTEVELGIEEPLQLQTVEDCEKDVDFGSDLVVGQGSDFTHVTGIAEVVSGQSKEMLIALLHEGPGWMIWMSRLGGHSQEQLEQPTVLEVEFHELG